LIISDFFTDKGYEKQLKILKNKHDVIAINVHDIREHDIPDIGYIELEDEETGEQLLIDTSDGVFQKKYTKMVNEKNALLLKFLQKLKIDVVQLKSDEPFEIPLRRFFKLREKRMIR